MRSILFMCLVLVGCAEGPLWEKTPTGVDAELTSVHGVSATDVWAVGKSGTVIRFDGSTWAKVPSGTSNTLNGVWAANTNDVWVVGAADTVLRWNGTTMSTVDAPTTFTHVIGLNANEVFFCGSAGLYLFSNGVFQPFKRGTSLLRCNGMFRFDSGVGALIDDDEVHVVSAAGSSLLMTLPSAYEQSLAMVSANDIWAFTPSSTSVLRHGGTQARELVLPEDMSVITAFVRSPTDVWLGGSNGYMAHFDGTELELKVAGEYSSPEINSIWGVGNVTFAVGGRGWAMRLVD